MHDILKEIPHLEHPPGRIDQHQFPRHRNRSPSDSWVYGPWSVRHGLTFWTGSATTPTTCSVSFAAWGSPPDAAF